MSNEDAMAWLMIMAVIVMNNKESCAGDGDDAERHVNNKLSKRQHENTR